MTSQLLLAIVTITLALVFYTIGVFSERKSQTLKLSHILLFACGLIFDATGTSIMSGIAKTEASSGLSLHQLTGGAALILMLGHLLWALWVYFKGSQQAKEQFHKFSVLVWLFWLIPYIAGVFIGMA